jgi:hypothetical protein
MSGLGTFLMANGDKYKGSYENDMATGVHTMTYADGTCGSASVEKTSDGTSWNFITIIDK